MISERCSQGRSVGKGPRRDGNGERVPAGRTGRLSSISVAFRAPSMLELLRSGPPGLDIVREGRRDSSMNFASGSVSPLRPPAHNQEKDGYQTKKSKGSLRIFNPVVSRLQ